MMNFEILSVAVEVPPDQKRRATRFVASCCKDAAMAAEVLAALGLTAQDGMSCDVLD